MLNNPGLAFEQNDQVICLIAVAEEHIADCHGLFGPIAMEDLELSPAQDRPVARLLRSSLRDGGAISHCELSVRARRKACALPPCAFEGAVGAIGPIQRVERGHVLVRQCEVEDLGVVCDAFTVG